MPKQLYKIVQFHGGLSNNSDPRDIAENELSVATDIMVDELGKIRMMGGNTPHVSVTPEDDQVTGWTGTLTAGYGLFYFSHDRTGGENRSAFTGTHDVGSDSDTIMTDSSAEFVTDALIGGTIYNDTDGSSGVITDNDGTTVTVAALTGGSDNSWDDADDDAYHIEMPSTGDDYLVMYDGADGEVWLYSRVRDIWDDATQVGGANRAVIDIGSSNTSTAEVNFYAVDGAMRVGDGNFANSNTNKWYGYIHRNHFTLADFIPAAVNNGDTLYGYSGWFSKDQGLTPPTSGLMGDVIVNSGWSYVTSDSSSDRRLLTGTASGGSNTLLTDSSDSGGFKAFTADELDGKGYFVLNRGSSGAKHSVFGVITARTDKDNLAIAGGMSGSILFVSSDAYDIYPPAGTGFNLSFSDENSASGTFNVSGGTKIYAFAASFVYDDVQESPLYYYNTRPDSLYLTKPYVFVRNNKDVYITLHVTAPFDPRISGARIYYKEVTLWGHPVGDNWLLAIDVDFNKGGRHDIYTQIYEAFTCPWPDTLLNPWEDADNRQFLELRMILSSLSSLTRTTVIGYDDLAQTTDVKYKTSVVANRRTYIGNVKYTDRESTTHIKGDAVIKSPVNQFDTFPTNQKIEANINDGDNIVKLEAYADRLLIFKKTKMELLNISQEIEFLEDTYKHKGVSNPNATCKTDFGIAWVNEEGCYIYDGQKVTNLLEKQGRQIIKESEWQAFIGSNSMIGYVPKKRQLIVVDSSGTSDGYAFLYDIVTQSWIRSSQITFIDEEVKTNFITDWNGDLVHAHTEGTIVKWDDAGDASSGISIKTKDIDFGNPGQKKTVYKVYISYKGDGSSTTVKYGVNGETHSSDLYAFDSANLADKSSAENLESWHVATLVPGTASQAKDIYSFQIEFDGTAGATFEINDISIVYRLKGVR